MGKILIDADRRKGNRIIKIDGSAGEGGGQILRSCIGLSLLTGQDFEIYNIRANRNKPGILRQHLTALNAAVALSNGKISGNSIGSDTCSFIPGKVKGGKYHFAVGTAGSATLVLQAILPALLVADEESRVTFEGGTHNPFAPPFDFLERSFLKVLRDIGADISIKIERYGFYPAGGGKFSIVIRPKTGLKKISLIERGKMISMRVTALYSKIPEKIAQSEVNSIKNRLQLKTEDCIMKEVSSPGPGNAVLIEINSENICYIATAFGEKRVSRKEVANRVLRQVQEYLKYDVPVGEYLADQLLIPMAMAGGGIYRTVEPSLHTKTNIEVIKKFLDIPITLTRINSVVWEIKIGVG